MAKTKLGWVGYTGGKPFWEVTVDDYTPRGKDMLTIGVFKSKKEARKRFEDVRKVYIKAD